MEGEENMRGLETLMNEFFSPLTGFFLLYNSSEPSVTRGTHSCTPAVYPRLGRNNYFSYFPYKIRPALN